MSFAGDDDEYQFDDAGEDHDFDFPEDDGDDDVDQVADGGSASTAGNAVSTTGIVLAGPPSSSRGGFVSCSADDLHMRISSLARHVCEIAACSEDEAILLLASFKWDPRRVEEALFSGDGEALRAKIGIAALGAGADACGQPSLPDGAALTDTFLDDAALEDVSYAEADACPRGHWFSNKTWQGCVTTAMSVPATALTQTRCPAFPGCNELVRPRMFKKFLASDLYARYREFIGRSFADSGSNVRHCPHPGCTSCVMSDLNVPQDVTCSAGHRFCFACRKVAHRPASCDEARRWLAKEKDEGADAKWLVANTKPCPFCRKPIEKNQGEWHWVLLDDRMTAYCRLLSASLRHRMC